MMKLDLILQIRNQIDLYQKGKIEKVVGLMKNELGGKTMTKFVGLRTKTCSYLMTVAKIKKQQAQKDAT